MKLSCYTQYTINKKEKHLWGSYNFCEVAVFSLKGLFS